MEQAIEDFAGENSFYLILFDCRPIKRMFGIASNYCTILKCLCNLLQNASQFYKVVSHWQIEQFHGKRQRLGAIS